MSMISSSLYRHSLGVDCGIIRMRLMTLSSIVLSFLVCAFVGVQVSHPYVIMGIMHVSSSSGGGGGGRSGPPPQKKKKSVGGGGGSG